MLEKKEVDVALVLDGRPGHEKQTLGIVDALANLVRVRTHVVDVSGRGLCSQWYSYMQLLVGAPFIRERLPRKIDLVIGTGSRTHSLILNLKKRYRVPAITCMTPAVHLRSFFDICFVPEHDGAPARENYFFTLGAPNSNSNSGGHKKDEGLILIGGVDEKSHSWDSEDLLKKIELVVEREINIHWTISSSPRTPSNMLDLLRKLVLDHTNCTFFDYRDTEKGWVEKQYNRCATVWVTADSISMLYEALSSGCKVNIFPMVWKRENSKFRRNEEVLITKKLVTTFDQWNENKDLSKKSICLNEAQRCAEHIVQTCWKEN